MEKVLQEHFWEHFFWVPISFKQYQNTFGCDNASFYLFWICVIPTTQQGQWDSENVKTQILLNLYFSMHFLTFIGLTFNGNKQTKKRWVESSDAITWWKPSQLKIFIKWWTNMEEECHIYQVIYIEIFLIINMFTIMISRSVYTKMQRGILHVSAASRRFLGILFSWS